MKLQVSTSRWLILPALLLLAAGGLTGQAAAADAPGLHVSGNKLVNGSGHTVVLHGVDRSGAEFRCVQGKGILAGPVDQASVNAMKSWDINAVRIPLNEACWNGESYVNPAYAGGNYRSAIKAYVDLLTANGIYVILDLHWSDGMVPGSSGCGSAESLCEKPMPDAAQAVPFWKSVAKTFKGNDAVLFDLFNEPDPRGVLPTEDASWACWLKGGSSCPGFVYKVAGMQTLINTVRAAGARNVIMAGGLSYANDLTEWLKYEPKDPDHNLAASWHSYNFNRCNNLLCWTSEVGPVADKVPLIAGEIGETDCADNYIDPLMAYLDSKGASYLAWSWNAAGDCAAGPELITDYNGDPTPYGVGYECFLQALAKGSP